MKSATRWALRQSTDGYLYECQPCGGRYSIGPSALIHVANGQAPDDLLAAVRASIARGEVPRVAIVGGQWQPLEVMGRQ